MFLNKLFFPNNVKRKRFFHKLLIYINVGVIILILKIIINNSVLPIIC